MNRSDLIKRIAEKNECISSNQMSTTCVDTVFAAISNALADGQGVELRGFGCFVLRDHRARIGRNPATGESVNVPAKKSVLFRPGKKLRKRVDN